MYLNKVLLMFCAVAYNNCDCFFLGGVLNREDGTLSITFLEQIDGRNDVFGWASQVTVETVDAEQMFITGLEND